MVFAMFTCRSLIAYLLLTAFLFLTAYNQTAFSINFLLENSYCTCNHSHSKPITASEEDAIFEKHKQVVILQGNLENLPTCHTAKDKRLPHICESKKTAKAYFDMCKHLYKDMLISAYTVLSFYPLPLSISSIQTINIQNIFLSGLFKPPKHS
jgi:hypothetical protein